MRERAEGHIKTSVYLLGFLNKEGLVGHWKALHFCSESAGKASESFEQRHSNMV